MSKLKYIFIFVSILYLKFIIIFCNIPNAPQYLSYDSIQKIIKIKADEIEDNNGIIYKFVYNIEDEEIIKEQNNNIIEINCDKGKLIVVYYSYSTNNMSSENSPKNSIYCATIPSSMNQITINYFTSTDNKVFLSWNPPADDGGTPIQNYLIKYKAINIGGPELNSEYQEITSLQTSTIISNNLESGNTYKFLIYPINYIVVTYIPDFLTNEENAAKTEIEIKMRANSQNCIISGNGLENFSSTTPSVEITLKAYNNNNQEMTSVESIFMLHVQDYCIIKNDNNKFVCEKQIDENNQNIFESDEDYIIKTFEKINDENGQYKVQYSIFGNGKIIIFVYQLIQGGLLGQYYNNVWFLEPFVEEKIDYKIDFSWTENTNIINNLKDFISIRWIGALLSPESNKFTFSISSDDGIRIYINNKSVLDHLSTPCDSCFFEYNMNENEYYWIRIEFVQLQGPSRIKLFWQTSSRPKEIIPSEFLFFPEIVGDTPKVVEISNGNIHPAKCYVEKNEKILFVGKVSKFNIIPVNSNDEIIKTINNDNIINFDINIINKDPDKKKGNLYFQSKLNKTDISNPFFYGEFIPLIPGEYTVEIKFGITFIKNSPYDIIVKHGEISPIYSKITTVKDNLSQIAGLISKLNLKLFDVMNNEYSSEPDYFPVNIKFKAEWKEGQENTENICGISQSDNNDNNNFKKIYAGNAKSNNDGTYELTISPLKAGKYNLYIYINEKIINECPFDLIIKPSILDATKCVYNKENLITQIESGMNFEINYQCRDIYGNNIKIKINDNNDISKEIYLISNENNNKEIKLEGVIEDVNDYGCYKIKYNSITKAGIYKTKILLNKLLIPTLDITVIPSTPSFIKSYVEIINKKNKYYAGEFIKFKIICLDENENIVEKLQEGQSFSIKTIFNENIIKK